MQVNVLSYLDAEADSGGGGFIRRGLLKEGRDRGHDLTTIHVYPRANLTAYPFPDLWMLMDVWNSAWHWRRLDRRLSSLVPWSDQAQYRKLVARATHSGRMVHFDHAYVDVCDLNYLPCNGQVHGYRCPFKHGPGSDKSCFRVRTAGMYERSRLNVFLSPLHERTIQTLLGSSDSSRSYVTRPVLDYRPFTSDGGDRDIPLLFVGPFTEAKGSRSIEQAWPDGEVQVVGPPTTEAANYSGYVGPADRPQVASLMRRARTFVFKPRWPEPFGRVVAEAALSGCQLDTNDRVGALSFGVDLSDTSFYDGAAQDVWSHLENLVAQSDE